MYPVAETALLGRILTLWCEVLELAPALVQADSHFLLLGGDSLQLARLLHRVLDEFAVDLPLHELVRFATPARMAACCAAAPALRQATVQESAALQLPCSVPASKVQQGLWLASQLAAPQVLYLASVLVHLSGPLDIPALQRACRALFRRHPLLLANFAQDQATRRLMLQVNASRDRVDLALLVQEDCAAQSLADRVQHAAQTPMSLDTGPLCRLRLFRLAAGQHALLLNCHHAVSDGWSGGLLLAQLAQLYAEALETDTDLEQAADLRFLELCRREAEAEPPFMARRLQWWRERLYGMEQTQDWLWRGGSIEPWPHRVSVCSLTLPGELLGCLRQKAQLLQHSLFALFLHAVWSALYACSGSTCQVLLVPVARRRSDEEASVGCFIEPLLLTGLWEPGCDIASALSREASDFAAAQRERLPLQTLASVLRPRVLPDGNPWTSIVFAFQSYPRPQPQWPGLSHAIEAVPDSSSQYALKLEVLCGDHWQLRIEYAAALLQPQQVTTLAATVLACLQLIAEA